MRRLGDDDIDNAFNQAANGGRAPSRMDRDNFFYAAATGNDHGVASVLRLYPDAAQWRHQGDDDKTALMLAAENGHAGVVRVLLAQDRNNIDGRSAKQTTALMLAAFSGHADIVRLLRAHGAGVTYANNNGVTALMAAAYSGSAEALQMILDAFVDVDARDGEGMTALLYAAQNGYPVLAQMLADRGADIHVTSDDGMDLSAAAEASGDSRMIVLAEQLKHGKAAKADRKKDKKARKAGRKFDVAAQKPAAPQEEKEKPLEEMVEDLRRDAKRAVEQINGPQTPATEPSSALKKLNDRLRKAGF